MLNESRETSSRAILMRKINQMIDYKVHHTRQTKEFIEITRNGVFDFGAYQLGGFRGEAPALTFGFPGGPPIVGQ